MKKMYMIDIETLGHKRNSIVTQIAVVEFDHQRMHNLYHANISVESCERIGMIRTKETMQWWEEQENHYHTPGKKTIPIEKALVDIFMFINPLSEAYVWAKGTDFDLVVLENAYDLVKQKIDPEFCSAPWKYSRKMDFRTALKLLPNYKPARLPDHNALQDALLQAEFLIDHYGSVIHYLLKKQEETK